MNEMLASFDNCLIYKVNSKKAKIYYLCVPQIDTDNYQMFLGFPDIDLSSFTKEDLGVKIKDVYDNIQRINSNAIYVLPDISVSLLDEAALENDNPYYNKILEERIQPITSEVYQMLVKVHHGKKKMYRTIKVIKNTNSDKKFAGWLSMRLGEENIDEIDYDKLCEKLNASDDVSINYSLTLPDYQDKNVSNHHNNKDTLNNDGISKKLTPAKKKNNVSPGFGNTKFIIVTLMISSIIGLIIANVLMK